MNALRSNGFFLDFGPEFDVFRLARFFGVPAQMIERLARLGYVSIGIVYVIAGLLAAAAGAGAGGSTRGQQGAFAFILRQPYGRVVLAVIALGLGGYALWRFVDGLADSERRGSDAKALAVRIGSVVRGVLYAVIAFELVRLLTRGIGGKGSDAQAKHWTARLIGEPFGQTLIAAAGVAVLAVGAYHLYKGVAAKLSKRLHLNSMNGSTRRTVVAISRFGLAARGVVFLLIGGSLVFAAVRGDPSSARGTSGALRLLSEPFDGALLVVIGVGLAAYGVYAFINARYRAIRA